MSSAVSNTKQESIWNDHLKEVLDKLLNIANHMRNERPKLKSLYIQWSTVSDETIQSLLEIRQKILEHNANTNAVSLSGTSIAIMGSIMGILGAAIALPTAGLSLFLTLGGVSTAAVGGSLSAGSLIARNFLSKSLCEDAKKIFNDCAKVTETLEEQRKVYFDLLNEFKMAVDEFGEEDFVALCSQLQELDNSEFLKDLELDDETKTRLLPTSTDMNRLKPTDIEQRKHILEKLPELVHLLKEDPVLSKIVSHICKTNLTPGLEWSKTLAKGFAIQGLAEGGMGAIGAMVKSGKNLKDLFKGISTTARVGLGVLNAVFMIWGIVDLVITSIDVHKGSLSSESEELLKVANDMKAYRKEVVKIMEEIFGWYI